MTHDHWFATRLVAPATWAIGDHGCDVIYLVAGEGRALLIDTGCGTGELPALVAGLIDLPTLVVKTHARPDHSVGNGQFARVHVSKADLWMISTEPHRADLIAELVGGIARILDGTLAGQPEKTTIGEGLRCEFGSTGANSRLDRLWVRA